MSSKSVRFATSISSSAKRAREDLSANENGYDDKLEGGGKRLRHNEDDPDHHGAWEEDVDAEAEVPSERKLLEAKRQRRRQRAAGMDEGNTQIDESTSLATEGIQIEPFHMRREESDGAGYFEGGTYVWRKHDPNEQPDAWLDSLNDENDSTSDKTGATSGLGSKTKKIDDSDSSLDNLTKEELYMRLLPLIGGTETVAQAIRRYGAIATQNKKKNKDDGQVSSDEAGKLAKTCLDDLTGAANALLLKGEVDIYDTRRHRILSLVPAHQEKKNLPTEKHTPAKWEYLGNQDGKVHGPFATEQMIGWMKAGYFVGLQKVKIRSVREMELSTEDDLMADLMDNDADKDERQENKEKGEWQWSDQINLKNYLP